MREIVTNPDEFFRSEAGHTSLLWSAAIVGAVGLITAARSVVVVTPIVDASPGSGNPLIVSFLAISVLSSFLGAFIIWAAYAASIQLVTLLLYETRDEFRATFRLVGWIFLPRVLGAVVILALTFITLPSVPESGTPAAVQEYLLSIQNSPAFLTTGAVNVVFVLWSAFLGLFVTRHLHRLRFDRAAVVIGIPACVEIGWIVFRTL